MLANKNEGFFIGPISPPASACPKTEAYEAGEQQGHGGTRGSGGSVRRSRTKYVTQLLELLLRWV